MYKSLNKFLLIISSIIITVVLAACGTKSQNKSQSESQSKLSSSREVLEKYSEVVNNVKSFKYLTEFIKNPATGEIDTLDRIMEVTSEEVSFSTEPFARLSNRTSVFSNYTIKKFNTKMNRIFYTRKMMINHGKKGLVIEILIVKLIV